MRQRFVVDAPTNRRIPSGRYPHGRTGGVHDVRIGINALLLSDRPGYRRSGIGRYLDRLLDAMPAARGAVMALQTGTFEAGWALGTAVTGGLLALSFDYRGSFALLALALPLSLACVALSARRPGGEDAPSRATGAAGGARADAHP